MVHLEVHLEVSASTVGHDRVVATFCGRNCSLIVEQLTGIRVEHVSFREFNSRSFISRVLVASLCIGGGKV